jgi:hypothetical protein
VRFSIDPWLLNTLPQFQIDFRLSLNFIRIRLDLKPSQTIDNPAAENIYLGPEGRDDPFGNLKHSALFSDGDGLVFEGDALFFDYQQHAWRKGGWGRIVVERPRPYLFEGIFNLDGRHYHVVLSSNYRKTEHSAPLPSGSTNIVVWNQADES